MQTIEHTGINTHPAMAGMTDKLLSNALVNMHGLPDQHYFTYPQSWRDLAASLHTLIEDERMGTERTAQEVGVPASVVADYRAAIGI